MNEIFVEQVQSDNLAPLRLFLRNQLKEEYEVFSEPDLLNHKHVSDETLQRIIVFWESDDSVSAFYGIKEGSPVGFISVQLKSDIYNNEDVVTATILAIYVEKNSRRSSVGRYLIKHVEKWCQDQGVHAINVSWLQGNKASEMLYAKCGFRSTLSSGRKILERSKKVL